ncbi:hypothetical protein CPLU01_01242 [Colletotrichum plurivorum]|uniref:Uncharacterized protein n=1 Tax=Colletotrichum plurivorum TaxID=2175906 RepID=A0A8H6NPM1_9PEZI|nr:hypothetical protein CPLU01_01242 [Colletotrichum plurivorum]
MSKGTFATNVDFDAYLARREALLIPNPARTEHNNGPGIPPLPSESRNNPHQSPLLPGQSHQNGVSGPANAQGSISITVTNPKGTRRGRGLLARYDGKSEETFMRDDVARELGLKRIPWKPGGQAIFRYNCKLYTTKSYVTVDVDICGLLLKCNFFILPTSFPESEGIELFVGSRLRRRLGQLSQNIRKLVDEDLVQRPSESLDSTASSMRMRPDFVPRTGPEPTHLPAQGLAQPAAIALSFSGPSLPMSGRASYHSSNETGPASTPITSAWESGSAMPMESTYSGSLNQGIDKDQNCIFRNDYGGNIQMQHMPQMTLASQQGTLSTPETHLPGQVIGSASQQGTPFTPELHLSEQRPSSASVQCIDPALIGLK